MCHGSKEFADLCDQDLMELQSYKVACGGVRPKRPNFTNSTNKERNDDDNDGFFQRTWAGFKDMFG